MSVFEHHGEYSPRFTERNLLSLCQHGIHAKQINKGKDVEIEDATEQDRNCHYLRCASGMSRCNDSTSH